MDLDRAVADGAEFFADAQEKWRDGHQSARPVFSHFVFWHREHVRIARSLACRYQTRRTAGTFRDMNAEATELFAHESLPALAQRLARLHNKLDRVRVHIANWRMNFPSKEDVEFCSVSKRVFQIHAQIDNHMTRFVRAERSL